MARSVASSHVSAPSSGASVWVNGEARSVAPPATIASLLAELGLAEDRVAVELNGEIAPRSIWAATKLPAGARLEIVHFVGGG